ncbi:MAG: PP2C family serine/threonine-protein phosphatase [Burkholderiaceae bacterium]
MKFSVFQVSRKGGRDKNEDRMGYCYTREAVLFVLADGMGGHPEGEVASQIALQTVSALFQKEAKPALKDVPAFLGASLMAAHHQIIRYAGDKGMLDTPRTTLVVAVVQDGTVTCVHCGDSRLYVVRDHALLTRTRDHSYMEHQPPGVLRMDRINRNILFTCLGSPSRPVFDVTGPISLQQGDKIMLCSDGLWGTVGEDDIVQRLAAHPVSDAVPDLAERALRNGGARCDNVTVLAMEWETADAFESTRGISTDSISDEVFASTIQSGVLDSMVEELDDDAIERSIAEINEAIRRSALRRS